MFSVRSYLLLLSLGWTEGTGIVLARLQPYTDAILMYSVGAAQGVLAVCFQVFLAHQAQLTITDSHRLWGPCLEDLGHCRSLRGMCGSLDGAWRVLDWAWVARNAPVCRGRPDRPWSRFLILCQSLCHLLCDVINRHASHGAPRILNLLQN